MKIIKLYLFSLLFPICSKAQENISMDSVLVAKKTITYSTIISNLREATTYASCKYLNGNGVCFNELKAALQLDVFSYFGIENEYNTELKKSVFTESEDYKSKLFDLKKIKQAYLNDCMYLDITKNEGFQISNYNLDKGAFPFSLGYSDKDDLYYFSKFYEIKSIPFKIFQTNLISGNENLYHRVILLPMSKQDAINFEDIRNQLKCILIFKPKTIIKKDKVLIPGYHNYQFYATTDKVRLILINPTDDKIYFDTNYYLPKEITKK